MYNPQQFYAGKKVLVTGATGFIGSWLTEQLTKLGAKVAAPSHAELNLVDAEKVGLFLQSTRPHLVFNCAGKVPSRVNDSKEEMFVSNVESVVTLLQVSAAAGVKRFIQIGTTSEYGKQQVPLVETMREAPVDFYGESKAAATYAVLESYRPGMFDVCVVRLANVFGPRQDCHSPMLIPRYIKASLTNGTFELRPGERDYVYVEDVVDGLLRAGAVTEAAGQIINIGSGRSISNEALADILAKFAGPVTIKKDMTKAGDILYLDITKARELLGWRPETDVSTGLQKTIQWYRDNSDQCK